MRKHRHKYMGLRDLPASVDWRLKNAVSPVKDAGECSASHVFAAIASLEGCWAISNQKLTILSEQNVIDCLKVQSVCKGGSLDDVYDYIYRNKGLNTNASYPYTGKVGTCSFDSNQIGAKIRGWVDNQVGCEEEMQTAVAYWGPLAAGLDSSR